MCELPVVCAQVTLLNKTKPDEFYNLAAQSHVHTSFELPVYTAHVDGIGTLNCLEAIRQAGLAGKTKFYQVMKGRGLRALLNQGAGWSAPTYPRLFTAITLNTMSAGEGLGDL